MKIAERIIEKLLRQQLDIDEMQFGLMLGYGTNASFTLRKVHEKIFSKKKRKKNNLYFAFVELKKAFDQCGP